MIFKIKNKAVWIEDSDIEFFKKYSWHISTKGYLTGIRINPSGKRIYFRYHRAVLSPDRDMTVDHKNGNKLDNRRSNLRIATQQQNCMNKAIYRNNSTGYKGVSYADGKFVASIYQNNIRYHLGRFATPQDAHAAYCEASKKYHGEFGRFE